MKNIIYNFNKNKLFKLSQEIFQKFLVLLLRNLALLFFSLFLSFGLLPKFLFTGATYNPAAWKQNLTATIFQQIGKVHDQQYPALLCTLIGMRSQDVLQHTPECFPIFSGLFKDILRDVWQHFLECLPTFSGMFGDSPRNIRGHFSEC